MEIGKICLLTTGVYSLNFSQKEDIFLITERGVLPPTDNFSKSDNSSGFYDSYIKLSMKNNPGILVTKGKY